MDAQATLEMMREVAFKKVPWCLVVGSLHSPSLGPAVAQARNECREIEKRGELFPFDFTAAFNSMQGRFPLSLDQWARYAGSILSLCPEVHILSDGALARAVLSTATEFTHRIVDRRISSSSSNDDLIAAALKQHDLTFYVRDGRRKPNPTCYVAGPYSRSPAAHTAQAFARARLMFGRYTPIMPLKSHDIDCAQPREYYDWLSYDAHLLRVCEFISRGAGESFGADVEERLAAALNIKSAPAIVPYDFDNDPINHAALKAAIELLNYHEVQSTKGF